MPSSSSNSNVSLAPFLVLGSVFVLTACAGQRFDPAAQGVAAGAALAPVTTAAATIGEPPAEPPADPTVDLTDQPEELTATTPEDRSEDPNRLVCRKMQRVGTHRRVEVCYTVAELEAMREETQRVMLRDDSARATNAALEQREQAINNRLGGF
jgi:hypothetical protein